MKYFFIFCGLLAMALGAVGAVLPFLPSTPFFLLAVFCFAKGSRRLHTWFLSTKLYQKHLESFAQNRAMTKKTKASILCTVTVIMTFGFIMMKETLAGRICLAAIWLFHVLYFVFRVKTLRQEG